MKVRALDSFYMSGPGALRRGDVIEVSEPVGRELIASGQVDQMIHRPIKRGAPETMTTNPPEAKGQGEDPLSLHGSPTGETAEQPSLSAADLQPKKRISRPRRQRTVTSSRSTKAGV